MSTLLLDKDLRASEVGSEVRMLARARTLSVLGSLDVSREATALDFLQEADLVQKVEARKPIISLEDADLRGAYQFQPDLRGANLHFAELSSADLESASLNDANLTYAFMDGTDLSGADLSNANLFNAELSNADPLGLADLSEADLSGANLEGANVTEKQLAKCIGVDEVLERDVDVAALVHERYPEGIEALLDLVSYAPEGFDTHAEVLKDDGRGASSLSAAGEGSGRHNVGAVPSPENLERLGRLLEAGTLRVPIQKTYSLDQAGEALRALDAEHTQGKRAIQVT
jgi:hypothetical protein